MCHDLIERYMTVKQLVSLAQFGKMTFISRLRLTMQRSVIVLKIFIQTLVRMLIMMVNVCYLTPVHFASVSISVLTAVSSGLITLASVSDVKLSCNIETYSQRLPIHH